MKFSLPIYLGLLFLMIIQGYVLKAFFKRLNRLTKSMSLLTKEMKKNSIEFLIQKREIDMLIRMNKKSECDDVIELKENKNTWM
mgnify:CR=1 FL=1